jgi:hypothetical protein
MVEEKANRNMIVATGQNECGPGQPPEPHKARSILPGPSAFSQLALQAPALGSHP